MNCSNFIAELKRHRATNVTSGQTASGSTTLVQLVGIARHQSAQFLKGLASEAATVKPFAGEFVRRSGLGSPSNAQRAVDGLLDRDVIDRENVHTSSRTASSGSGCNASNCHESAPALTSWKV